MTNTLILTLHGAGGSAKDLLPLAKQLRPQATIVSLKGNVQNRRFIGKNKDCSFDKKINEGKYSSGV